MTAGARNAADKFGARSEAPRFSVRIAAEAGKKPLSECRRLA